MRRKILNPILIILGLTLLCFGYLTLIRQITAHPTDEKLLREFYEHEEELEILAQLQLTEEDIDSIYIEEQQCYSISGQKRINSMDDPKCEKYIDLLTPMGLDWYSINLNPANDVLWLTVSSRGISVSGSSKGYYYSPDGSIPAWSILCEDTDKTGGQLVFHQITDHWYIYKLN